MAYARTGDGKSDVHVYLALKTLNCGAAIDAPGYPHKNQYKTTSFDDMLDHLMQHIELGDLVPKRALEGLLKDRDGDEWSDGHGNVRITEE